MNAWDNSARATTPSTSAASSLSPAYPDRAAWGTAAKLRAWQAEALRSYMVGSPRDYLAVATPGAGKTTFALRVATELLAAGVVRRVTVVAPTEHLKRQWADAAARVGVALDPNFRNSQGRHSGDYVGVAVTYAQVASKPAVHRARTTAERTLVILDEIHHAGDALSWGDAVQEAFEPATRRLGLTGTPFRSDTSQIPFVTYAPDNAGARRSVADFSYGYGDALLDGVVRPVIFLAYSGQMRWRTRAGDEISAALGEPLTQDMIAQAWRTALDPEGEWIPQVLKAADVRLSEMRRQMPDAAGLVIATDQESARAYASHLRAICGEPAAVVISDDPGSSQRIEEFTNSNDRWMVAVRMVSEGVDIPRLAVGVYATSASTPLFFAQAVGRFVRARKRGETASVFLPSVPTLLQLASNLEAERDHCLDRVLTTEEKGDYFVPEDQEMARAQRSEPSSDELDNAFEALEAQASFDRVLFDGGEFGTQAAVGSDEELDYLGIPGLLDPDQVATLLKQRQAKQIAAERKRQSITTPQPAAEPVMTYREVTTLRKELSSLVSAWAQRTGRPHGAIHNELRRVCGGPAVPLADAAQIQKRIDLLRRWFVG